jgi:hypothetical protein
MLGQVLLFAWPRVGNLIGEFKGLTMICNLLYWGEESPLHKVSQTVTKSPCESS